MFAGSCRMGRVGGGSMDARELGGAIAVVFSTGSQVAMAATGRTPRVVHRWAICPHSPASSAPIRPPASATAAGDAAPPPPSAALSDAPPSERVVC